MTYNSNPVNIAYYQPIFQYNRLKWEKKTEPKRYEMSKRVYLEDMESIAVTATTYFFNVLRSQKSLEMARSRYESTQQLYAIAQERFGIGTYTKVIEAEAAIAQAKAERGFSATLTAQFGLTQTGNDFVSSYRNPIDQEIVGLSLSVPIVDWGLGKGKVQMAKTQQEIILTQVEQEIMDRRQDIYIRVVQFNRPVQAVRRIAEGRRDSCRAFRAGAPALPQRQHQHPRHQHGPEREGRGLRPVHRGAGQLLELLLQPAQGHPLRLYLRQGPRRRI